MFLNVSFLGGSSIFVLSELLMDMPTTVCHCKIKIDGGAHPHCSGLIFLFDSVLLGFLAWP
jgi:hypothetical protein